VGVAVCALRPTPWESELSIGEVESGGDTAGDLARVKIAALRIARGLIERLEPITDGAPKMELEGDHSRSPRSQFGPPGRRPAAADQRSWGQKRPGSVRTSATTRMGDGVRFIMTPSPPAPSVAGTSIAQEPTSRSGLPSRDYSRTCNWPPAALPTGSSVTWIFQPLSGVDGEKTSLPRSPMVSRPCRRTASS
jgi:hypothetical protein